MATDYEAEGLLEGAPDRQARIELLRTLEADGFTLQELREAAAADRLALLPVERVLAGEGGTYTLDEVAEDTGLPRAFLIEAHRALGLPLPLDDDPVFTEDGLELARQARLLLDGGLPPDGFLELARVMSQAMSTVGAAFASVWGDALLRPGDTESEVGVRFAESMRALGPLAGPALGRMLNLRLREQIRNNVIGQAELATGRLPGAAPIAAAFVDMVGFTRLGENVQPEELRPLVRRFEAEAREAAAGPVRLVKTIGDAAMLVSPETDPLLEAVLGLVERFEDDDGAPDLRAGVALGEALPQAGDWYGRPVNLASRITSFARPGSVVADEAARDRAEEDWAWSFAGRRRFKGVGGEVAVFRLRRPQAG